jgi:hypothetical protein
VTFDEEKLKGQIRRKDGILLLEFEGDNKLERLTLGGDGRLFVEHFDPKANWPDGKPLIGIGTRQQKVGAGGRTDTPIAVLAGEWKITYSHDAVRVYTIEKDGKVTFDEEKLKGQIRRKDGILLLEFEGDNKLERLTLGGDGRLFVEHFDPKANWPDGKPLIGIGTRQQKAGAGGRTDTPSADWTKRLNELEQQVKTLTEEQKRKDTDLSAELKKVGMGLADLKDRMVVGEVQVTIPPGGDHVVTEVTFPTELSQVPLVFLGENRATGAMVLLKADAVTEKGFTLATHKSWGDPGEYKTTVVWMAILPSGRK